MSIYLRTKGESNLAIAICPRCKFKVKYVDLKMDPNDRQYYCSSCVDLYDPYRLPPRAPDQIQLQYPRPEEPLEIVVIEDVVLDDGSYWVTSEDEFVVIDDDQILV